MATVQINLDNSHALTGGAIHKKKAKNAIRNINRGKKRKKGISNDTLKESGVSYIGTLCINLRTQFKTH
jgi:hypothetical protein